MLVLAAVLVGSVGVTAGAQLTKGTFLNPGDNFLITDNATSLQWVTPFYTRGKAYNDLFIQSLNTANGLRYATGAEVTSMINNNFGSPTTLAPGDAAGFAAAGAFLSIFGINENQICGGIACPRTQGYSSDIGSGADQRLAFGMIQLGSGGWFIANNDWSVSETDIQMGSWLVRASAAPDVNATPEPASVVLLATGLLGVVGAARRRGKAVSSV